MQNNSIIGRLVEDPVLKTGASEPYVKLRIACNYGSQNPLFLSIFFSGKLAEQIAQYLNKGNQVYIEYIIKNSSFEKGDVKVNTYDFYGNKCDFLTRKNENEN